MGLTLFGMCGMARRSARARPDQERVLCPARRVCPACGNPMHVRYENRRTLVTLSGALRLRLKIRRCEQAGCARHRRPYRPEAEGAIALPQHEFGLDVVALVGALRYRGHRSVPELELPAPVSGKANGLPCCLANWIRLSRLWLWPPLLSSAHLVAAG